MRKVVKLLHKWDVSFSTSWDSKLKRTNKWNDYLPSQNESNPKGGWEYLEWKRFQELLEQVKNPGECLLLVDIEDRSCSQKLWKEQVKEKKPIILFEPLLITSNRNFRKCLFKTCLRWHKIWFASVLIRCLDPPAAFREISSPLSCLIISTLQ